MTAGCVLRAAYRELSGVSRRMPPALRNVTRHGAHRAIGMATLALALLLARPALACAVCYGAPGDPLVKGANNGILLLLGVVGAVQIGFIAMFWSFWRRARAQRRFRDSFHVIEGGPHS